MKRIMTLALCAMLACVLLAGCGQSKYLGTWVTKSFESNGERYTSDDEELGSVVKHYVVLTLDKDDKGTISRYGIEEEISWEIDGTNVKFKDSEGEHEARYANGELTIDTGDEIIVLEKE